ncbi:hypothetical protein PAMP_007135 [Pampus punctatissimus]
MKGRLSRTFLHSRSQALDVESRSCSLIDRRSCSLADFRWVVIAVYPDAYSPTETSALSTPVIPQTLVKRHRLRAPAASGCRNGRHRFTWYTAPLALRHPAAPAEADQVKSFGNFILSFELLLRHPRNVRQTDQASTGRSSAAVVLPSDVLFVVLSSRSAWIHKQRPDSTFQPVETRLTS